MNKYHFDYHLHEAIFAESEEEARKELLDKYPILGVDFELADVESPAPYFEVPDQTGALPRA